MRFALLSTLSELQTYQEWLQNAPGSSLWQSLVWKSYQEALGRETRLYGFKDATALVIIDRTACGFSTWDIPRGPLGEGGAAAKLLAYVVSEAKKDKCLALYFSPLQGIPNSQQSTVNCQLSARHEQPEATLILDLTLSEETLLREMHPKGRYNIRVAQKRGVRVEEGTDIDAFFELLKKTSGRDGFRALPKSHYDSFLRNLPGSFLLLAFSPTTYHLQPTTSQPIAALLGVTWGKTGIYYYGASDYAHRALMAPSLLQLEAMRLCRGRGCTEYDFLGITPETYHLQPTTYNLHPWASITRFKMQFGGTVKTYPPEQEVVLRPVMKALFGWKRRVLG